MISNTTSPPTIRFGACLILAAIGCAVLVHAHPERLRSPEWVALLAAALLGFGGVCVILSALRLHSPLRWLVCGLLVAMAAIPGWIATSDAATQCTVVSLGVRASISEAGCRGAFGLGTLVLLVMLIFAVRGALRQRP